MSEMMQERHEALSEEAVRCTDEVRSQEITRELAVLEMAMISQSEPVVPAEWEPAA